MNEIFRAMKQAEYDEGKRDTTMSYYQKGYLPAEVAAEELSMSTEAFLQDHKKWLAAKRDDVLV